MTCLKKATAAKTNVVNPQANNMNVLNTDTSQVEKPAPLKANTKAKTTRASTASKSVPDPNCIATRTTNVNQHPGDLVKTQKQKRHTPEEKAEEIEQKLAEKQQKVQMVAALKNKLEDDNDFAATPVPGQKILACQPLWCTETYLQLNGLGNESDENGRDKDTSVDNNELDGDWKEAKLTTDNGTLTEPGMDTEEVRPKKKVKRNTKGVNQEEVLDFMINNDQEPTPVKAGKKGRPLRDTIRDARKKLGESTGKQWCTMCIFINANRLLTVIQVDITHDNNAVPVKQSR